MNRVWILAALAALSLGCDLVTTLPGRPPVMIVAEDFGPGAPRSMRTTSASEASPPPKTAAPSGAPASRKAP